MMEPQLGLQAAARLEDSYRVTSDEIASVRRVLSQGQEQPQPSFSSSQMDPDAQRIQQFKDLLAERRASALTAFASGDARVDRLRTLLAERREEPSSIQYERPSSSSFAVSESRVEPRLEKRETDATPVHERLFNSGLSSKLKLDMARREADQPIQAAPQINPTSAKLKRDSNVEDILLRRSQEYKAHIEELRREKEQKELDTLKSPRINKHSRDLKNEVPVAQRLHDYMKIAQAKREKLRTQIVATEKSDVTGTPRINPSSKQIHRSVDQYLIWQQEKERKLQRVKEQRARDEIESVKATPTISKVSERIMRQQGRTGRIEDHLLAFGEKTKEKREMLVKKHSQPDVAPHPQISAHSANLQREGDVADRLYALAQRKKEQERPWSADPTMRDQQTGQRLFSPSINPRSAKIVRARPIEEILQDQGQAREARRSSMAHVLTEDRKKEATQPKVGAYSQLLVGLLEERTQKRTEERLHEPIRKLRQTTKSEIENEREHQYPFRPQINPISEQIDRTVHGETDPEARLRLFLKKQEQYVQNKTRRHAEVLETQMKECTFSPRVTARPRSASSSSRPSVSGSTILDRNLEWMRGRDQRLESERAMRRLDEVKDCTFRPSLSPHGTPRARSSSAERGRRDSYSARMTSSPQQSPYSQPRSKSASRISARQEPVEQHAWQDDVDDDNEFDW